MSNIRDSVSSNFQTPRQKYFVNNTPLHYSATRRIFNSLLGVWNSDETLSLVSNLSLTKSVPCRTGRIQDSRDDKPGDKLWQNVSQPYKLRFTNLFKQDFVDLYPVLVFSHLSR